MRWEQLTVPDFAKAVEAAGRFGILPIGVLEPHATHLPLGMDMLAGHAAACRAAEIEPAIVFPPYPFGINHEGAHLPGAVVIQRELALKLLQNLCDEMARNGLKKILILNSHGGNRFLLGLFVQTFVEQNRDYCVYSMMTPAHPAPPGVLETTEIGHACEYETSAALALFPELVKMQDVPQQPFPSLRRNEPLADHKVYSPMDWYAMYPTMQVGEPAKATPEKGKAIVDQCIQRLVAAIRSIKADEVTDPLMRQFQQAADDPTGRYGK
jgi:creatinine amidohydrolase